MSDWRHISRWLAGAVDRWARRCTHQPERITVRIMPGPQPVRRAGPMPPARAALAQPPEWPAVGELVWVHPADPHERLYDGPAQVTARTGTETLWVKPAAWGLFPFEVDRCDLRPIEPASTDLLRQILRTAPGGYRHAAP